MKKNKPKPWYRLRNIFLALMLALFAFIGWAFLEIWEVYTAEPNPTIDYRAKLRRLTEEQAGVSTQLADQSWAMLADALERANQIHSNQQEIIIARGFNVRDDYDDGTIEYSRIFGGRILPTNVQREINTIELIRKDGVFDILQEFTTFRPGIAPLKPNIPLTLDFSNEYRSEARLLAQILVATMRLSLVNKNYNQLNDACKASLALSSTISYQGTLINYLVARAIEQLTIREMQYELIEAALDEETCQRMLVSLRKYEIAPIKLIIEGERICLYDKLQWSFSDDGKGNGYLVSGLSEFVIPGVIEPKPSIKSAASSRFFYPSKSKLLNLANQRFDACIARSLILPSSKLSLTPPWGNISVKSDDRYALVNMTVDSLQSTVDREPSLRLLRVGTRIMLAIEIYYAQHTRWPNSLNDLVPEILPQLPVDPLHGGPFGYRLADNDPFNRTYFLYSFGLDATDDGGIELITSDGEIYLGKEALNEPNSVGLDYVINKPRPEEW